jgi:hypothetical protein
MKHFKLTSETKINFLGIRLFRIECTVDCKWAKVGEKGGWVEKEENISGDAWVSDNARVYGNAEVSDNARVYGNAEVSGNARVYGNAEVSDNARVYGNAEVSDNAWVSGNARVYGDAWVSGDADYCCFQSFGSRYGTTTVFKQKDGSLLISCGCFSGTLEEFATKVELTHGDNEFGKVYKAIIELIKIRFGIE